MMLVQSKRLVCAALTSFLVCWKVFTENCVSMHIYTYKTYINLCCLKLFCGQGRSFPYVLVEDLLNMYRHDSYRHQATYADRLSRVLIFKIKVNISGHSLISSTNLLWKIQAAYPHRPVLFYVNTVPGPHWTTCIFRIIRWKTVGMHALLLQAVAFSKTKLHEHCDKLMNV